MPLQSLINRKQAVKKRFFILLGIALFLTIFTGCHYLFMINELINIKTSQLIWSVMGMIGTDVQGGAFIMYKLNQPLMGILPYSPGFMPVYTVYFQLLIPLLVSSIVYFLWYEHRTLGFIPKDMDLKQWQTGIWRPSLILLYRSNNARHKGLFYTGMFLTFPVALASSGYPDAFVMAMFFMLPVVMFAPIALFKVIYDYRMINKGVPVECHFEGTRTEHARGGRAKITWDIQVYQAKYKGKTYYIEGTSKGISSSSITFVALINPESTYRNGILLDSFYKS